MAALSFTAPPPELPFGVLATVGCAALTLCAAGLFATFRAALLHSVPSRVLAQAPDDAHRERLRPLLEHADSLRASASAYTIAMQVLFLLLALGVAARGGVTWPRLALVLAVTIPSLVFACEVLPGALRGAKHDALLVRGLAAFRVLHLPLAAPVHALEVAHRFTMRLFRIPEKPRAARVIVEGLRDVIEDSDLEGGLGATTTEIIENAVGFRDVDVAEVMTPRTEIHAVEVGAGLGEVARIVAEGGHGRLPVYEGNLDAIVGIVSAHDVIRALSSEGSFEDRSIRKVMRPAVFVPETKLVSELLQEFRRDKQKVAIVLDEYGGTSGLVSLTDILAEIVGDLGDEFDDHEDDPIWRHEDGSADVQAFLRVSEVNEELALNLPEEEDYETLAGFVLARLGRFPKQGEVFLSGDVEYTVLEANDRRVLRVRIKKLAPLSA
jgi:CBS domain containing-hemolysin-like protein